MPQLKRTLNLYASKNKIQEKLGNASPRWPLPTSESLPPITIFL